MPVPFRLQPSPYIVPPCEESLAILYCDDDVIVVNKPSGLLSVPGRDPRNHDSVLTRVREHYPSAQVVHRLDLVTSGLMVLALHKTAAGHLGKQFAARTVGKCYVAVVAGLVEHDEGEVDLPIICDWPNRPVQKICFATGKAALTSYRVMQRDHERQQTRLALVPHTGRSHQLRIHMRELGHPILGCEIYAPDHVCYAADRLLLHAEQLSFQPLDADERLAFTCKADF